MSKIIKYNNLTVDEENKVSIDIPNFNVIDEDENSNEFEINYTAENGGELTPEDILEIAKAQAGSVIGNARKEADYILIEAHKNAVIEAEEIKKMLMMKVTAPVIKKAPMKLRLYKKRLRIP